MLPENALRAGLQSSPLYLAKKQNRWNSRQQPWLWSQFRLWIYIYNAIAGMLWHFSEEWSGLAKSFDN